MASIPLLAEPLSRILLNRVDARNASRRTVALDQPFRQQEGKDSNIHFQYQFLIYKLCKIQSNSISYCIQYQDINSRINKKYFFHRLFLSTNVYNSPEIILPIPFRNKSSLHSLPSTIEMSRNDPTERVKKRTSTLFVG